MVASKKQTGKPNKPYPEYPLFPHATGRWAKKIKGKFHYFGPWNDPEGALQRYLDFREGRSPRSPDDGLTLRELLNRFLTSKDQLVESGEIVQRTFDDYKTVCTRIASVLSLDLRVADLTHVDFEKLRANLAKTRGPTSLANDITRIRMIFKYAYDNELIDRPVRFGQALRKPSSKALRAVRNQKGPRMCEAEQIRGMCDAAGEQLQAMFLLGINCGFGNHDCGMLPRSAVDFDAGWVDFPRPKTANRRRCPLWKETIDALKSLNATRAEPVGETNPDLVFVTSKGGCWAKQEADNPISKETSKVLKRLGYYRPGLGFYALRHTFQTIAGETGDQVAVDHIMGHVPDSGDMSARYREKISDERLVAVAEFVRSWLFADTTGDAKTKTVE